ncbi:DUF1801 domain-containing protein [Paenibacillus pasadenensis]|uniref:iron chaperone n=1 Tax=Paenibacillus pasadenensis TaxID=217090 RepID=UPI0020412FB0|nr:DUF1801 domain-containing protein [Paenibacillus pasadenensis]MCM3745763.1 DUF1801 domain-containing protein [Paenibacillus pasadenensis]
MTQSKTAKGSIDEYISQFEPGIQEILQSIRGLIRETVPDAKEKISYGMPTFELYGNLVHFAAFKNHIGFYPAPSGIEAFKEELEPYHKAKGTLQFPIGTALPMDLIRRIVEYRVAQNRAKASAKANPAKKKNK